MNTTSRPPLVRQLLAASVLAVCLPSAEAALTINTTRVVLHGDARNTSVVVANPSKQTFAVQSWVNTQEDDTTTSVPLLAVPTLFRLAPGKEQSVQINVLPNHLPLDRESLFYFNVQEIPQADSTQENILNIAIRTRIKLFYRPSQLNQRPEDHLQDLEWSVRKVDDQLHLQVNNPSPFHYTFSKLEITGDGQSETLIPMAMAAPLGQQTYPLSKIRSTRNLRISFNTVNDYGGATPMISKDVKLSGHFN